VVFSVRVFSCFGYCKRGGTGGEETLVKETDLLLISLKHLIRLDQLRLVHWVWDLEQGDSVNLAHFCTCVSLIDDTGQRLDKELLVAIDRLWERQ
jgi:hypothetical protein